MEHKEHHKKFYYPYWDLKNVKKLDYDDFNSCINMLTYNLEVVSVPLFHRNTVAFKGMAERTFYLCQRKVENNYFALDQQGFMNCWSMKTGDLVSRTKVTSADYSDFVLEDRSVYDKGWFDYSLVCKPNLEVEGNLNSHFAHFNFKLLQIGDKGEVVEKLSFLHQYDRHNEIHLYFSKDLGKMIELLLHKHKKHKFTYNLYLKDAAGKWVFEKSLPEEVHWHHKTLYPFNLDLTTFDQVKRDRIQYDMFKYLGQHQIKCYNPTDGIEMIFSTADGKLESYIGLQYTF